MEEAEHFLGISEQKVWSPWRGLTCMLYPWAMQEHMPGQQLRLPSWGPHIMGAERAVMHTCPHQTPPQ